MLVKIWTFIVLSIIYMPTLSSYDRNHLIDWGKWSYGTPEPLSWGEGGRVKIGNYCSIAGGVKIFLGGDHRSDWVTTFPFSVVWPQAAGHIAGHPKSK